MRNLNSLRRKTTTAILWQGMLLLLPLVLLACLGVVFLQRDRVLIMQEARDHCQGILDNLSRSLPLAFQDGMQPEPNLGYTQRQVENRQGLGVAFLGSESQLVYPKPYPAAPTPPLLALGNLSEEQQGLWLKAIFKTENSSSDRAALWDRFLALNPPESFAAIARFSRATELAQQGKADSITAFEDFLARHPGALGESGVPLKPLAEWQRLLLRSSSAEPPGSDDAHRENMGNALNEFCRGIIESPGVLTPYLLENALSQFGTNLTADRIDLWRRVWASHELSRALHSQSEPQIKLLDKNVPNYLVISNMANSDWLLTWIPSNRVVVWKPLSNVFQDLQTRWRQDRSVPDYCFLSIQYGTQTLFSAGSEAWNQKRFRMMHGASNGSIADLSSMPLLASTSPARWNEGAYAGKLASWGFRVALCAAENSCLVVRGIVCCGYGLFGDRSVDAQALLQTPMDAQRDEKQLCIQCYS